MAAAKLSSCQSLHTDSDPITACRMLILATTSQESLQRFACVCHLSAGA